MTGCFRNERNHGLRALHVSVAGEVSCLRVTSGHPVWSVTRGAWIGAGELAEGEALAAWRGEPVAVLANLPEADTATWNLEVENEHVYRVGPAGILVHNTCPTPKELFEGGGAGAAKTKRDHSAVLRKNLRADGRPVLPDEDAAHIVASGHPRHAEARGILDRAGIDVDDAINWGGLPSNTKVPNPLGKTTRNVTRRHKKMDQVTRELRQAEQDGTVHETLRDIESRRQSGKF